MKPKLKSVLFRMRLEDYKLLAVAAAAEQRSMSAYVRKVVIAHLAELKI
jgi:uncharacterized protein (DUF1778 family)